MKRIISLILCFVMLVSSFAINASAKDTEIRFSANTVEGQPGDTVDVEIYLDKNPGTWAAKFNVCFEGRYFTLLSVDNGEVFNDGEYVKSLLTNNGYYTYYAQGDDVDKNNTNTGLILTLTFEITSAAPNGAHDLKIEFPQDGKGWFIDATESPEFETEFDVSCTKNAVIIVNGSDATESPETKPNGEIDENPVTKPAPGIPVTEAVTNGIGQVVTNADDGSVMTQQSTDTAGNPIYYETDKEGEKVTGDDGEDITFADTTKSPEKTEKQEKKDTPAHKIILVCAIAAVVIGAIVVIIVVTKSENKKDKNEEKKDEKKEDSESADE